MDASGDAVYGESMADGASTGIHELHETVFSSPSILGRLMAVAGLYDREADQYRHPLSEQLGAEQVDRGLRHLHAQVFLNWLGLSLRQQTADLSLYLRSKEADREAPAGLYASAENWIPPACPAVERELFLSDLGVVISVIREAL